MAKTRRQQLEEMLADEPQDAELRYFLAMDYVAVGDLEGARQRFDEMFALTPEYVPAYVQAGQLLVRLGRDAEAGDVFRHGIEVAKAQNDLHAAGEMEAFLQQLTEAL